MRMGWLKRWWRAFWLIDVEEELARLSSELQSIKDEL